MKKIFLFLTLGALTIMSVGGCSCSKVNEETYNRAIDSFNNTDAITFQRSERVLDKQTSNLLENTITKASYVFEKARDGKVKDFKYNIIKSLGNSSNADLNVSYYYSTIGGYISKSGKDNIKEKKTFEEHFNVNNCHGDHDCLIAISSNIAPIYESNNILNFKIEKKDDVAIATFSAACPVFEQCKEQTDINYVLEINTNGEISHLSYEYLTDKNRIIVNYLFDKYGSNNIKIDIPVDVAKYPEGIIEKVL